MTYCQRLMEDAANYAGRPWAVDTLRVWFNDDRQYWGVSYPGDKDRDLCLLYWPEIGGERFDGTQWVPMRAAAIPAPGNGDAA